MFSLVIPSEKWEQLKSHLLSDSNEHLAFMMASVEGSRYLVRTVELIGDNDLSGGSELNFLSLKLPTLLHVMNEANRRQLTLIEAHSHPFSKSKVQFSPIDIEGQTDLVRYIRDISPDANYAALVLGQHSVKGHIWRSGRKRPDQLAEIRILGPTITLLNGTGKSTSRARPIVEEESNYHRQILALGAAGHEQLEETTVAIIGLGGIGSVVAQQLAHLGVGKFILIDDDYVEQTNLNRLVGAAKSDIGRPKVEVAASVILRANPRAMIGTIHKNVRHVEAINALKRSEVLFGCMDTDSGRMILNEFSLAYLVPYIDFGVGINVDEGRISGAGGRVVVWVPGRPCLLCSREFRPDIAAEELESSAQQAFRRKEGYVSGHSLPEPAVMSLNGTVASLGVTEFLALVTGFRPSNHYAYYDMLDQRVGPRIVKRNPTCVVCALEGVAGSANLTRYSRIGIPDDIPGIRQTH